ncbi:MAG: hypothetical protein QOI66_186 [Myxococcales bacterium]|nr:hypothetical protein [Myxococcales bacterium]
MTVSLGHAVKNRVPLFVCLTLMMTTWLSACAWMYPTAVPVHVQTFLAVPGARAATLLVLLPGRGNRLDEWEQHGFVAEVRAQAPGVDVVAVDAHLGYYLNESVVDRVWTDVIAPARAQGYRRIWIAGISMGGLGAVAIARQHAQAIDGMILLAPYLGPKSLIKTITDQGGPQRWTPADPGDAYQRLWSWLRLYGQPTEKLPRLVLAFGDGDRLHPAHQLLATLLPSDQVMAIHGGHDWTTWRQLWQRYWSAHPPT